MRNSLLQRRAFYAALFILLLSVAGMKNAFAQTQVATLQHGEDISIFYGQNAFVEAHTAAETGDVITLSSGTFTPCDITKAITLRGAGCVIDTVTGVYPTIIPNSFKMNVTDETAFLTVEGIFFSGTVSYMAMNNPKFIKCNFERFQNYNYSGNMQNAQITNCIFRALDFYNTSNSTLINSVIWAAEQMGNTTITATANNCYIRLAGSAFALTANNCIIGQCNNSAYSALGQNSVAYYCIGIMCANYGYVFHDVSTFQCWTTTSYSNVFDTFDGNNIYYFSYDEPFILKDEIATSCIGTDGTEVGIHGGTMPYSSRPSYMILKRCNVANRSTIDGKLSVDIEVITEDE